MLAEREMWVYTEFTVSVEYLFGNLKHITGKSADLELNDTPRR